MAVVGGCAAVAAGSAGAAPGGGAVVIPTTCVITLPNVPTFTSPGQIILLPNGSQVLQCNASLPAGAAPVDGASVTATDQCITVATPSGKFLVRCRPS